MTSVCPTCGVRDVDDSHVPACAAAHHRGDVAELARRVDDLAAEVEALRNRSGDWAGGTS